MIIFPAIDIKDNCAVRLTRGDYDEMKIYSRDPGEFAAEFAQAGAVWLHTVDLDGARDGSMANFEVIARMIKQSGLNTQVGGGIRSTEAIERYIDAGARRVILGTRAATDSTFLREAVRKYGEMIAVGVDIREGFVAVKGWRQTTELSCDDFFGQLCEIGVSTVICTDISRDGVLDGTNIALYEHLRRRFDINIIASGGVSSTEDIRRLRALDMYGCILGKALYEKRIALCDALECAAGGSK